MRGIGFICGKGPTDRQDLQAQRNYQEAGAENEDVKPPPPRAVPLCLWPQSRLHGHFALLNTRFLDLV